MQYFLEPNAISICEHVLKKLVGSLPIAMRDVGREGPDLDSILHRWLLIPFVIRANSEIHKSQVGNSL